MIPKFRLREASRLRDWTVMGMRSLEFAKIWHSVYASALTPLHLEQAIHDEVQREAIDPVVVANPTTCKLGRWMLMMPDHIQKMPDFVHLERIHERFHQLAGEMVSAYLAGDLELARQIMDGDLAKASHEIDEVIDGMSAQLSRHDGYPAPAGKQAVTS